MNQVLVDSSVLLDVFEDDPVWSNWSVSTLNHYKNFHLLCINSIIYTELSIGFKKIEELEHALTVAGITMLILPRESLFLAGKAFLQYKRNSGTKRTPLPDFYIGAHASVEAILLITRDTQQIKHYFPTVTIISPS